MSVFREAEVIVVRTVSRYCENALRHRSLTGGPGPDPDAVLCGPRPIINKLLRDSTF